MAQRKDRSVADAIAYEGNYFALVGFDSFTFSLYLKGGCASKNLDRRRHPVPAVLPARFFEVKIYLNRAFSDTISELKPVLRI